MRAPGGYKHYLRNFEIRPSFERPTVQNGAKSRLLDPFAKSYINIPRMYITLEHYTAQHIYSTKPDQMSTRIPKRRQGGDKEGTSRSDLKNSRRNSKQNLSFFPPILSLLLLLLLLPPIPTHPIHQSRRKIDSQTLRFSHPITRRPSHGMYEEASRINK